MKARMLCALLTLVLSLVLCEVGLAQDPWDVDQSDTPSPTQPPPIQKPILFEGPNVLRFSCDRHNIPIISIAPNPKVPVQVFYSLKVKDTLVSIELFTKPLHAHRRPSLFQPPEKVNAFSIRVTYKEDPHEVGLFQVTRPAADSSWTIRAVHETGFIKLETNPDTAGHSVLQRE